MKGFFMTIINIENYSFSYPTASKRLSLDHVSLQIERGEYVALCGKSGSGKTTLLQPNSVCVFAHSLALSMQSADDTPSLIFCLLSS